jgi:MYXO-CTERM domain-containing protein
VQTGVNIVVTTAFAAAGLDPYLNLATSMGGLGTLGVIVLQAVAAAAVIGFFARRPDRHWWRTGLAPAIGLAGLVTAIVLVVRNFAVLTGTTSAVVTALPWLLALAALVGLGYAWWLRRRRPAIYAALAKDLATPPQAADELPVP